MKPLIVFDYDGVICDSFGNFLRIIQSISKDFNLQPAVLENRDTLRDLTSSQVLKQLGISPWKLPFVVRRLRKEMQYQSATLTPISGVLEQLKQLRRLPIFMAVLTSNSENNVSNFLKKHQVDFFDALYCGSTIFGKHRLLQRLAKEKGSRVGQTLKLYVGDETRDMDAAKRADFKSLAVSWGYNSAKILETVAPDFLIHQTSQLYQSIDQWIRADENR